MAIDPQTYAQLQNQNKVIRKLHAQLKQLQQANNSVAMQLHELLSRPRSITEEIDAIPGRRIDFVAHCEVEFDSNDEGKRGQPATVVLSQDGPFIWTHYPMVLWRPTAPDTATNLGVWRPVSSYPLPTQQIGTDIIDLSYEIQDGGAQRNYQNDERGPIFSRPDNIVPLPCPTQFAPASTIQFFPIYHNILFNGSTPPTAGVLSIDFIGYRIVNL